MKNFKKLLQKATLLTAVIIGISVANANAQGAPGNGGAVPANVPIDGGASLLLAGGVAYGVKKIRDNRKKKKA